MSAINAPPPPSMPQERTFLSEGNVTVTNARFISNGQTYAIAGVTSVRTLVEPPGPGGTFCIVVGVILLIFAFVLKSAVMGILGAGLAVIGVLVIKGQKATHHLVLHSASGEVRAISSTDGPFIGRVLEAINNAIISRS